MAREGITLSGDLAQPGDIFLLSGTIRDLGMAELSQCENLTFDAPIVSDTAALHGLVAAMLDSGVKLRVLRDPSRGGLAATLNEIAKQSGVGIMLHESAIAVNQPVEAACAFLGLDPLYVANEGKLVAICVLENAGRLLEVMRAHPLAHEAVIIGEITKGANGFVQMVTKLGGRRIVDWLEGEQLPRIC